MGRSGGRWMQQHCGWVRVTALAAAVVLTGSIHVHAATPDGPAVAAANAQLQQAGAALQSRRFKDAAAAALRARQGYEKALGADSLYVASALDMQAAVEGTQGHADKALEHLTHSLQIRQAALPKDHPYLVVSLTSLAQACQQAGNAPQAAEYLGQAADMDARLAGKDTAENLPRLENVALLYEAAGMYGQAESYRVRLVTALKDDPQNKEALPAQLAALAENFKQQGKYGPSEENFRKSMAMLDAAGQGDSENAATLANNLAETLRVKGDYAAAEALYERALRYDQAHHGPESAEVATVLSNQGLLAKAQGQHQRAEALFHHALAIREQLAPKGDLDTSYPLNNLGDLMRMEARFPEAEALYTRALKLREAAVGHDHPLVATTLQNLGLLYADTAQDAQARASFQAALDVYGKTVGPQHVLVANTLHNMAAFERSRGNIPRAADLLQRALNIQRAALGDGHPLVANTVNSLALLMYANGQAADSEKWFQTALEMRVAALGPDHPDVAMSRVNVAQAHLERGDFAGAEALLRQALPVLAKAYGAAHPLVGTCHHNLGFLRLQQNRVRQAEREFATALKMRETALGPDAPEVAETVAALAAASTARGRLNAALNAMERLTGIRERRVPVVLGSGSDEEKRLYNAGARDDTNQMVGLDRYLGRRSARSHKLALTMVLRTKGRALDFMTQALGTLRQQMEPGDQERLDELTSVQSRRSELALAAASAPDPAAVQQELARLAQRAAELQAALAARSDAYRLTTQAVELDAVAKAVPKGAVLVEFVPYYTLAREKRGAPPVMGEPEWAAYLLDDAGNVNVVDLGTVAEMSQQIAAFRTALETPGSATARVAGRLLDARLMAPVRKALRKGVTTLLLAPDGDLSLLPMGALVDEQGRFLLERYELTYVASGRDLLRMGTAAASSASDVLLANPAFDKGNNPAGSTRGVTNMEFTPLPGTAEEAQAIAGKLNNPQRLEGRAASEGALKAVKAPRILHIATHGFFADLPGNAAPRTRGLRYRKTDAQRGLHLSKTESKRGLHFSKTEDKRGLHLADNTENGKDNAKPPPPIAFSDAPMLRSGLALAGANRGGSNGEDGVLTAAEASGLDLWGTQLVVLSACQTGTGSIANGEGVLGLRRAFVMNGAQTQVMSLWNVDDEATRLLMEGFYNRLLAGGGRGESLRQAQLELMRQPKFQHPYFWSAFISAGDWRPLR